MLHGLHFTWLLYDFFSYRKTRNCTNNTHHDDLCNKKYKHESKEFF